MCVHCIRIPNRKIDFNIVNDKPFLYVPCGFCYECKQAKRRDYEIRAYYEWQFTQKQHGMTLFYTLTYNDDNLPKLKIPVAHDFDNSSISSQYKEISCFDKKAVQLFIKRFGMSLYRKYGITLRYFLTSERGEHATKRPHYHALFFLDFPSKNWDDFNPKKIREYISSAWQFGFNKPGKFNGVVQDNNAIRYVAKYVTKDCDLDKELQAVDDSDFISNCRSFHLNSQKFGMYALECLSDNQRQTGTCNVVSSQQKSFTQVVLPTYLLRKLFYDVRKNSNGTNSYVLNESGRNRKLLLLSKLAPTALDNLICRMTGKIDDLPCECRKSIDDIAFKFFRCTDINCIAESVLDGKSVRSLYDFKSVYQDRCSFFVPESPQEDLKLFLSPSDGVPFDNYDTTRLYNDMECFKGFSDLLKLFDCIDTSYRYLQYKKNTEKYNSIQRQRFEKGLYKELKLLPVMFWAEYYKPYKPFKSCCLTKLNRKTKVQMAVPLP